MEGHGRCIFGMSWKAMEDVFLVCHGRPWKMYFWCVMEGHGRCISGVSLKAMEDVFLMCHGKPWKMYFWCAAHDCVVKLRTLPQ